MTILSTVTLDDFAPKRTIQFARIKDVVDRALRELSPTLNAMYSKRGRPSIPPERLLKASVRMGLSGAQIQLKLALNSPADSEPD